MSGRQLYDVFLSFRGVDTRNNFADFLFSDLTNVGICVFRDEEGLERGGEIFSQLTQAIKQSKISIPVISEEYASSKSCLMELDQMVECHVNNQQTIIPIFYHLQPSDVSNCRGTFEIADDNQRRALRLIGNLAGYSIEMSHRYPSKLIKEIVWKVEEKLKTRDLILPEQLVGVDPHVKEIMAKLKVDCHDGQAKSGGTFKKVLLIHGIPGVGKTVLAKYVYNKLNHLFDACSFLEKFQEKIRDQGIVSVQNGLISHLHKTYAQKFNCSDYALTHIQNRLSAMKVLLLLDDVKDHEQLNALVGDLDWLKPGSRVIVTSQRDDVLKNVKGAEKFGHGTMQQGEALTLFCRHAFGTDSSPEEFEELAKNIVAATDGLPLALNKVGKFLSQTRKRKPWTEQLKMLKEAPNEIVEGAFLKRYTTLNEKEQNIFLDIACFFNEKDKRIPYHLWFDLQFYPSISILSLHAMSMVEIRDNKKLHMREILKNFGREIVNKETYEPCQRSRLWKHEEALDVLRGRKGTEKVKALGLEFADGCEVNFSFKCDKFDNLRNLRFLKLDRADIQGDFQDHFSSLRWLAWQGGPGIFDDHLNLNLQNLVILDLSESQVHKDWSGWKLLAEARKLKVLNLANCVQLIDTPEFSASMELERLILEGCSKLVVNDSSFGNLTELVYLNMKGCSLPCELAALGPMSNLKELAIDETSICRINVQEGSMRKLKFLSARNCKRLTEISDSISNLESLTYLSLDGSKIETLAGSIGSLEKLKTLSLKNCQRLANLPDEIGRLSSLQLLDLSNTAIPKLPTSVENLEATEVLGVRCTRKRKR